jgi:hypothetical protein
MRDHRREEMSQTRHSTAIRRVRVLHHQQVSGAAIGDLVQDPEQLFLITPRRTVTPIKQLAPLEEDERQTARRRVKPNN